MTRTPDPANPQIGDRFTDRDGNPWLVLWRRGEWVLVDREPEWVLVDHESDEGPWLVDRSTTANWRPVLPPIITEPVTLHHWATANQWGFRAETLPLNRSGRKIELRPDGTWTEVTS